MHGGCICHKLLDFGLEETQLTAIGDVRLERNMGRRRGWGGVGAMWDTRKGVVGGLVRRVDYGR